ncbi:(2Fe-2S) ferredoxin domain-containing protein [Cyclobacterium amurskyense]|jgi:NADH:ubiquinone oxidoreductase subunit E|uniref:(2Fe-2S) ferredoxin domain-containing protein n=1 Tax=Cyclobacterium amurskyense TaxID=320787 RepID=A0A0H4PVJ1_9BACT|nr:(2Fe-2S) ferredoxin domain-containing protein [Cyclobacterium amurskyense]AKP52407.1 hypothetical protein CA2015_3002 [Cyclobacterium amurskyense]|tara:strand:- start:76 stop:327 length:252 start_codon:yes stop_codon:yes gene_type:complete
MKPRRKFVFVCNGKDCKKNDAKSFTEVIKNTIKEDDFRGNFKLVKSKCMDCCKSGPVAVIGHELIKKGDKDKLLLLLRSNLHK